VEKPRDCFDKINITIKEHPMQIIKNENTVAISISLEGMVDFQPTFRVTVIKARTGYTLDNRNLWATDNGGLHADTVINKGGLTWEQALDVLLRY